MLILAYLVLAILTSLKLKALPIVEREFQKSSLFPLFEAKPSFSPTPCGIRIHNSCLFFPNRSATSKLTMENVPWHSDVKAFSEALSQRSNGEYEVACEHVHSCCVLLAKVDKFKVDGQWFTWIDYNKFHDLVCYLQHSRIIYLQPQII